MSEPVSLSLSLLAGILLGGIFFAGLYWTVLKGTQSATPALWFSTSFLLRTGLVLIGFYAVSNHDFKKLLLCLLGFMISKPLTHRILSRKEKPTCN